MRILQPMLVLATFAFPGLAAAQRVPPVVVEFFTSQGCVSCPPADAVFHRIAARPEVLALALHVDYWDYLGWKDIFGQPAHSRRQRAYAAADRKRSIYTPQMIIGGVDRVVGSDLAEVEKGIEAHLPLPPRAMVDLTRDGDKVRLRVAPADVNGAGAAEIHVVRYVPEAVVTIDSGENAGHVITYTNIVTDWLTIARWDGVTPAELAFEAPGTEPVAVLVQREHNGPMLTAARLP
jgi:hypothetical protein